MEVSGQKLQIFKHFRKKLYNFMLTNLRLLKICKQFFSYK